MIKDKGLVSVIVASYNHAKYLPKRMESLLSQTYTNLEIIVIDDCSTDNSREVLSYYTYDSRVNLILKEKNEGWVAVSNQGAKMAKGDYVIFANCDDYCHIKMIESLVLGIRSSKNIGVSFCRSEMVDQNNISIGNDYDVREKSFRELCIKSTIIYSKEIYKFFLNSCVIPNLSAALIKKECFEKVGYFSDTYKACCDWDIFLKIFDSYDAYSVSDEYNSFRQHNNTIRSALKGKIEYEEFIRLLLSQIRDNNRLTFIEKMKYRTHVMKLWILHLTNKNDKGYNNFKYHFTIVYEYDKISLIYFIPGLINRILELVIKLLIKIFKYK